jgi:aryl-alcohol dehydrogenase-like predicted oxidoreductase
MGYLTGTVTAATTFGAGDLRAGFPRFTAEARRANWPVVQLLEHVARRKRATPGQIALAWLLARHPSIVPIPGTTKLHHFEENQGALDVKVEAEDLRELEDGFAKMQVQGARTTDKLLQMTDIGARLGTSSRGGHGLSPLRIKG